MDCTLSFHQKQVRNDSIENDNEFSFICSDVNYDPKQREQEEYESKMKEVRKVEEFRRERERHGKSSIKSF